MSRIGTCVVETREGKPFIVEADAYIGVSDELIAMARSGTADHFRLHGDHLTLHASNGYVEYLLGAQHRDWRDAWLMAREVTA